MIKLLVCCVVLTLPIVVSGCDRGPYDPSAHHHADASTGTMLSGHDAGADVDGSTNDPSIRSNFSTTGGK